MPSFHPTCTRLKYITLSILIFFVSGFTQTALAITSNEPLQKLTVILDWFVNPDHAPLFVAQQQGYYQQQGLDVTFIAPADPTDPPKLVAAGKADIAVDYQPHLLLEIAQGLPLVQVGTLIATPLDCLAVLDSSSIKTIKDLKGKKIGYSEGGVNGAMLQGMLQKNGLSLKDVELINIHYDLSQALLAKKVDAVTGLMRNFELIQMQLAGQPARAFYPEENGMPPYDELILVTNNKKQTDPRIQHFLTAVELGTQYLINHPEESWELFAKAHPELNNDLNKRAWFATLPRFALRPAARDPQRCKDLAVYLNKTLGAKIDQQLCQQK
jgi:putative hydroxymethylpyrimidine transport system substrate-binding protein